MAIGLMSTITLKEQRYLDIYVKGRFQKYHIFSGKVKIINCGIKTYRAQVLSLLPFFSPEKFHIPFFGKILRDTNILCIFNKTEKNRIFN